MMENYIKLSEWAKQNSYTYRGAFGAFKKGKIKGAKQLESGAIVVEAENSETLDVREQLTVSLIDIIEKLNNMKSIIEISKIK